MADERSIDPNADEKKGKAIKSKTGAEKAGPEFSGTQRAQTPKGTPGFSEFARENLPEGQRQPGQPPARERRPGLTPEQMRARREAETARPEEAGPPGTAPTIAAERPTPPSAERPAPSEAAPGVAPSHDPQKIEEAKRKDKLRREKMKAKKERKGKAKPGEAAKPGMPKPSIPGMGEEKEGRAAKLGLPGLGGKRGGEGDEISQTMGLLKKMAKIILQIIMWIVSLFWPCCCFVVVLILIGAAIASLTGLV